MTTLYRMVEIVQRNLKTDVIIIKGPPSVRFWKNLPFDRTWFYRNATESRDPETLVSEFTLPSRDMVFTVRWKILDRSLRVYDLQDGTMKSYPDVYAAARDTKLSLDNIRRGYYHPDSTIGKGRYRIEPGGGNIAPSPERIPT